MAYIVLVNPAILSAAGMPLAAVTAATCLSAAFGSILMGVVGPLSIALAPGMGLNAYFTYTFVSRCTSLGRPPWALSFSLASSSSPSPPPASAKMILRSIPHELYAAVASGIGLFIAFIGFRNAAWWSAIRQRSLAWAISATPLPPWPSSTHPHGRPRSEKGSRRHPHRRPHRHRHRLGAGSCPLDSRCGGFHSLADTALKARHSRRSHKGLLEIVFVFFFVDLFDNLGTLVAVTKRAGLIAPDHSIPRLDRILFADASATIFGSLTGTSTVTSYVESTAGVAAGGRSGVTAIVTGLLFLGAIGAAPFVGIVPPAATAPPHSRRLAHARHHH